MSAFGDPRDRPDQVEDPHQGDGLPERIIVVREAIDAEPESAAAELDALTAEVAAKPIDLDEVDLRASAPVPPGPAIEVPTVDADSATAEEPAPERIADDPSASPDAEPWGDIAERTTGQDDDTASVAPIPLPGGGAVPVVEARTVAAPGRGETGPGTLRPLVPEPVIAARRTSSPSMARRTVSRLRALVGLVVVVVLAGVGLAGAIGGAVLLVVLVLSRAFGSDG